MFENVLIDIGLYALWVAAFVIFRQSFMKWSMKNDVSYTTFRHICLIVKGLSLIGASSFGRVYLSMFLLFDLAGDIVSPMIERYRLRNDPEVKRITERIVEIAKSRQRPQ